MARREDRRRGRAGTSEEQPDTLQQPVAASCSVPAEHLLPDSMKFVIRAKLFCCIIGDSCLYLCLLSLTGAEMAGC